MNRYLKLYAFLFQVIIPGSWIFSLIFNMPSFLVYNVKDNACVWMSGEEWMEKTFFLSWSAIVFVAMAMMAGLYSRIVYTLWFKRDHDNQHTFQQRVSIKKQVQYVCIVLSLHWRSRNCSCGTTLTPDVSNWMLMIAISIQLSYFDRGASNSLESLL